MNPRRVAERAVEEDSAWEIVRTMKEVNAVELSRLTGLGGGRTREILRRWERLGRVYEAPTIGNRRLYTVGSKSAALDAQRTALTGGADADPRVNMWRAMYMFGTFSPRDLVAVSNFPEAPVSERQAAAFCQSLLVGEYLRVVQRARPGHRPAIYLLARRTGPKPPVERRVRALWDPNLEAMTYVAGLGVTS